MNNVEAKFILQGYRPNGADAADETFTTALEQTRRDPALRDWFAREQAFDGAVSAKLNRIQAPAGLREAIMAGGRVTVPVAVRHRWWRHPALLAAAAGVAVIIGTSVGLWPKQAAASSELVEFALNDVLWKTPHDGHGAEAQALQAVLSQPATRLGCSLPVDFVALSKGGCRTMHLEGRDVLEVCFKRDGTWFHCYIAQRHDFPLLRRPSGPSFAAKGGASVASWSDTSRLYVLVTKSGPAALEKLL